MTANAAGRVSMDERTVVERYEASRYSGMIRNDKGPWVKFTDVTALLAEVEKLRSGIKWALENLGAGIEWGGPFDDEHQQGVYHCTHCDARWKPTGDDEQPHREDCGLAKLRRLSGERP
jgi:hypothetical protein